MKLNVETAAWARRYRTALRRFLGQETAVRPSSAKKLGCQAASLGLETLCVAGIHGQALKTAIAPEHSPGHAGRNLLERAETFFKETIIPIEATHRAARKDDTRIEQLLRSLQRRTGELSVLADKLEQATARRQVTEAGAAEREGLQEERLAKTRRTQKCLRDRMRVILSRQEVNRKHIGSELRDEIAQALVAIDLNLLALQTSRHVSAGEIEKSIAVAQGIMQDFHTEGDVQGCRWNCS